MCMLIHHPAGAQPFAKHEFADFHRRNPNGFGIIWWQADTRSLHARRGMWNVDQTFDLYQRLIKAGHREMALHWRFATSGAREQANCHPFLVDDVLVMHNGVLSHRSTQGMSDTQCFIEDVLAPAIDDDPWCIYDDAWLAALDDEIGGGNKLLLWHHDDEKPIIVGEKKGLWHRGRWMSNTYAWNAPRTNWWYDLKKVG